MKTTMNETLDIPEGIHVSIKDGIFHIKGAKGELAKELHKPLITSKVNGNKIQFHSENATQREKKIIMTFMAHLKNTFKGVSEGHIYKLKVCSSHFPMTATAKGSQLEIKNFFGEQTPRMTDIPKGVSIKVDGQIITLEGVDKDLVSQTAASIEKSTRRPGFDKRIFQDGVYIIEKDGKSMHE